MSAQNVTVKRCIRSAYDVPEAQILGGPKWTGEDRFQIEAKAPGPAGDHELSIMLRSLLAQRFQLALHRESRTLPGYALVVAKSGLKAKASTSEGNSRTNSTRRSMDAEGCTMAQLAQKLAEVLHLPVADSTAVSGAFDFQLEWAPEETQAPTAASGPSLFAALQEQLGLKLQPGKVPAEVIVIDRVEKPTEN